AQMIRCGRYRRHLRGSPVSAKVVSRIQPGHGPDSLKLATDSSIQEHERSQMLCFEVEVNDEGPVIAGAKNISVLSFTGTYVASHQDIELRVGGLISPSQNDNEHIE